MLLPRRTGDGWPARPVGDGGRAGQPFSTFTSAGSATGGSPGACWTFSHTLQGSEPFSFVNLVHRPLSPQATFDSVQIGGIASVDLSVDAQVDAVSQPGAFGEVIAFLLVASQGGTYWTAGVTYQAVAVGGFTTMSFVGLTETDFDDGNGAHPDFMGGGPVTLGVVTINSCNLPGGCSSTQSAWGRLDNFAVAVNHASIAYPGTGEDFVVETGLNGAPCTTGAGSSVKLATGGDILEVCLSSPVGTFLGAPLTLLASVAPGGTPLTTPFPVGLPQSWLDPFFMVIVNGLTPSGPFGSSHLVGHNGPVYSFVIPPALAGQRVGLQAGIVLAGVPANGLIALTEAHVIEVN